jgi:hypothetical protein
MSRSKHLHDEVERAVERVLGRKVAHDAILMAAGLDSLGSEELLAELSKLGKIQLPGTRLFVLLRRVASRMGPTPRGQAQHRRVTPTSV